MYLTLNLQKSINSAAASISACQAFFPCPSIVAANNLYLYFPAAKSAAFKKIADLSVNARFCHAGFTANAPLIPRSGPDYLQSYIIW